MGQYLKTHDKLRPWDVPSNVSIVNMRCVFCNIHGETHDHLFFDCNYSSQVWNEIRVLANMHDVNGSWKEIVDFLQPIAKRNAIWSIIGRLVFSATSYYIWQERNNSVFKKPSRSSNQLFNTSYL